MLATDPTSAPEATLLGTPRTGRLSRVGSLERRDPLGRPDAVPALGVPPQNPDAHMGTMCPRPSETRRSKERSLPLRLRLHRAVLVMSQLRVRCEESLSSASRSRSGFSERRDPLGRPDAVPAFGVPPQNPDAHMGTMCPRPSETRRSKERSLPLRLRLRCAVLLMSQLRVRCEGSLSAASRSRWRFLERRDSLGRPDAVPALGVPPQNPDAHMGTMCPRPSETRRSKERSLPLRLRLHRAVLVMSQLRVRCEASLSSASRSRSGFSERRDPLGRPDAVPALGVPPQNPDAHMGTMCPRPSETRRSKERSLPPRLRLHRAVLVMSQLRVRCEVSLSSASRSRSGFSERRDPPGRPDAVPALGVPPQNPDAHMGTMCPRPSETRRSKEGSLPLRLRLHRAVLVMSQLRVRCEDSLSSASCSRSGFSERRDPLGRPDAVPALGVPPQNPDAHMGTMCPRPSETRRSKERSLPLRLRLRCAVLLMSQLRVRCEGSLSAASRSRWRFLERRDSLGRPDAVPALGVPPQNPDAHMGTMCPRPSETRRSKERSLPLRLRLHRAVLVMSQLRVRCEASLSSASRSRSGFSERRDPLGRPDAVPALGVPPQNPDAHMGTMCPRPSETRRSKEGSLPLRLRLHRAVLVMSQLRVRCEDSLSSASRSRSGFSERRDPLGRPDAVPALGVPPQNPDAHMGTMCPRPSETRRSKERSLPLRLRLHRAVLVMSQLRVRCEDSLSSASRSQIGVFGAPRSSRPTRRGPRVGRSAAGPGCAHGDHVPSAE